MVKLVFDQRLCGRSGGLAPLASTRAGLFGSDLHQQEQHGGEESQHFQLRWDLEAIGENDGALGSHLEHSTLVPLRALRLLKEPRIQ